jgi:hypothetical protein
MLGVFNDKTGDFMGSKAIPLIPFQASPGMPPPTAVATDHSLLELDSELDALLDQILGGQAKAAIRGHFKTGHREKP